MIARSIPPHGYATTRQSSSLLGKKLDVGWRRTASGARRGGRWEFKNLRKNLSGEFHVRSKMEQVRALQKIEEKPERRVGNSAVDGRFIYLIARQAGKFLQDRRHQSDIVRAGKHGKQYPGAHYQ